MATELGVAYVTITAETKGFQRDIQKALGATGGDFDSHGKESGSRFGKAVGTGLKVAGGAAVGAAAIGIGAAFTKGLDRYMKLETAEARLKALKFDAASIEAIMKTANASVKGTAFSAAEAATAAGTLTNAGIRGNKELEAAMKTLVNTSAVAQTDLNEVSLIFGKIATKGKLDGETLAQLTERNIPVIKNLATELNVTEEQVTKMVSNGEIDFETFRRAMDRGMDPNAAVIMGQTLEGTWKNAGAALGRLGESVIKTFGPMFKDALNGAIGVLDGMTKSVEGLAKGEGGLAAFVDGIRLDPEVQKSWADVKTAFGDLGKVVRDDLWPPVKDVLDNFFNKEDMQAGVRDFLKGAAENMGMLARGAADAAREMGPLVQKFGELTSKEARKNDWDPAKTANEWGRGLRQSLIDEFSKKDHSDPWTEYSNKAGRWLHEGFANMGGENDPIAAAGAFVRRQFINGFTNLGTGEDPVAAAGAAVRKWFTDAFSKMGGPDDPVAKAGATLRKTLIDGFTGLGTGEDPVAKLGATVRQWFIDIGGQVVDGFSQGMGARIDEVQNNIRGWFDRNVVQPAKNALGIQSPSTVFAGIASDLIQGFLDGFGARAGELAANVGVRFTELKDGASARMAELRDNASTRALEMRDNVSARALEARDWTSARALEMRDWVSARALELRDNASARFSEFRDNVSSRALEARDWVSTRLQEMRDNVSARALELRDNATARFTEARDNANDRFTGMRDTTSRLAGELRDWVGDRFTGMKDRVIEMGRLMAEGFGTEFDKLRAKAAEPVRFVLETVINKGIIDGWNQLDKLLGLNKKMDPINVPAFHGGGRLPGRASGSGDNMLVVDKAGRARATVRSGEAIIPEKTTRRHWPAIKSLINSGELPAHAAGGIINFRGHRFTEPFAQRLQAAEAKVGRQMSISQGGFRPATSYSGTSHAGDAVDIGGAYHAFIAALRSVGVATWDRAGKGNWAPHAHGVPLPGHGSAGGSAVAQAQDYLRGGDGLGGRDNGPRVAIGADVSGLLQALPPGGGGGGMFDMAAQWIGEKLSSPVKALLEKVPGAGAFKDAAIGMGQKLLDAAVAKLQSLIPIGGFGGAMGGGVAGPDWAANARLLMEAGKKLGADRQAMKIALMTASQESSMGTNRTAMTRANGDGDVGWFQQRTTRGDGTIAQLADPLYALGVFLHGVKVPAGYHVPGLYNKNWRNMDLGAAAQAVQVSAFPGAYSKWAGQAEAWLSSFNYDAGGWLKPGLTMANNQSGEPEAILTASQWDRLFTDLERVIEPNDLVMAGSGGPDIHVHTVDERRAASLVADEIRWARR